MKKINKVIIFLSVLSLAIELPLFQVGGSGVKLWMLAVVAGGVLLLRDLYRKGFSWLKKSKIFWLGLGLALFSALGMLSSPLPLFSTKQLAILLMLVVLGVFFELNIKRYRKEALWGLFVGITLSSLYALYQNVAFDLGWPNFETMAARPNGFFPEPDWLGMYLALGLVPFLTNASSDRPEKKDELSKLLRNNYAFYLYLAIVVTAIIITVARASWLALIAELVIITFLYGYNYCRNRAIPCTEQDEFLFLKKGIYFTSVIVLSLFLINVLHLSRFNISDRFRSIFFKEHVITVAIRPQTGEKLKIDLEEKEAYRNRGYQIQEEYVGDENVASREEKAVSTWNTIKKHPLLGSGLGITLINTNYQHNANNLFLEWWASAGMGGLMLVIGMMLYLLINGLRKVGPNSKFEPAGKAMFVLAGTAGFIIVNMFNASIMLAFAWFYFALLLTIINNEERRI